MIAPDFQKSGNQDEKEEVKKSPAACRVLLVEDDIDDQFLGKKRLEASGKVSEVLCFANGEELIEYMEEQGFHDRSVVWWTPTVIILDLNMPKVNGFEILKRLKSDSFLREIPVVVVSGNASQENVRKAYDLKADAFFTKPMNVYKFQSFLERGWQWPTMDMWMR